MRLLRKLLATSVLILTVGLSAFAGEMSTPLLPPQSAIPTGAQGEITTGVDGEMSTPNSVEATAADLMAGAALSLVQGVLSLV